MVSNMHKSRRIIGIVVFSAILFVAFILACVFGPEVGELIVEKNNSYSSLLVEQTKQATHNVTIFWGLDEAPQTISVREDYSWDIINGTIKDDKANTVYGVYIFQYSIKPKTLEQEEPTLDELLDKNNNIKTLYENNLAEGLRFEGLYTLPNGSGIKYADSLGRTLKNVTDDLTLYAWWRNE